MKYIVCNSETAVLNRMYDEFEKNLEDGAVICLPENIINTQFTNRMIDDNQTGKYRYKHVILLGQREFADIDIEEKFGLYRYARHELFKKLDLEAKNIYYPQALNSNECEEDLNNYKEVLTENPIDVAVVFLGSDGGILDYRFADEVNKNLHIVEFSEEEKEEFDYFFTNEKHKFFVAKMIEDKISVNENDVTKLYTDNKANFDAQNIPFSQAREIIQRDLLNQQIATLEAEELNKLVEEMQDKIEITKKEILFSKGDAEVLKTLIVGKIISKKMADEKFEDQEQNKKDLEVIRDNVYINYYLDLEVRKNVKVTQEEVVEIYEKEKAKLGNVTPNSAYQQITNSLFNNRAIEERNNLINKIVEDYKVDEIAKEYAEAE